MPKTKEPPTKDSSLNPPKERNKVEQTFDNIMEMTLPEVDELDRKLRTKFKIGETVAMPQVAAPASEKIEEQGGNVSVKIVEIKETGLGKIEIYRIIKDFINEVEEGNINIVQARKRAEEGDKVILTNVPREKAENFKKQLEKKVEVEIK